MNTNSEKSEVHLKHFLVIIICLFIQSAKADPSPSKTYQSKNSLCVVKSSAGEYPMFTVLKNNKIIFSPKSDGVDCVSFSKDGKYVALGTSEIHPIDVKDEYYHFAIINCLSEKVAGFDLEIKELTAACPKEWGQANEELTIGYYAKKPGEQVMKLDLRKLKLP
jgi:hypothetical protein